MIWLAAAWVEFGLAFGGEGKGEERNGDVYRKDGGYFYFSLLAYTYASRFSLSFFPFLQKEKKTLLMEFKVYLLNFAKEFSIYLVVPRVK